MNKSTVYYCEGEDDLKLINALKVSPGKILAGKAKKLNVIQNLIPKSILISIKPNSNIVFLFDTDVLTNLSVVKKNIDNIQRYCVGANLIFLLQVKNLEDELVRCTDMNNVLELTKSKSLHDFKTAFKNMKDNECRYALERHNIDISKLWVTPAPAEFDFADRNSDQIKQLSR